MLTLPVNCYRQFKFRSTPLKCLGLASRKQSKAEENTSLVRDHCPEMYAGESFGATSMMKYRICTNRSRNRVMVFKNLGATVGVPVVLVDTSLLSIAPILTQALSLSRFYKSRKMP